MVIPNAERNPDFSEFYCFSFVVLIHFLCLHKENESKEMHPVALGPPDFLALLKGAEILKTRLARTVQNLFPAPFAVLSKCQWGEIKNNTGSSPASSNPLIFLDFVSSPE